MAQASGSEGGRPQWPHLNPSTGTKLDQTEALWHRTHGTERSPHITSDVVIDEN